MAEIILDNYSACYEYGRLAALGELDAGRAALKAATETGMDYGSAQIYTRCEEPCSKENALQVQ